MHFSTASVAFIGVLPFISSAPLPPPGLLPLSANDKSVLQLALFLETLEYNLYTGGYEAFSDAQYTAAGFPSGFRENVAVIAQQEATHIATISSILLANNVPIPGNCTFKFPYSSPTTFVDLANMVTTVGIGAYIGGSTLITDNPNLLQSAASILPNEARHDAYLRVGLGASPFPTPFDTPLPALFAFNLAQQFVTSCPDPLPIVTLPKLTLVDPMPPADLQPPTPAGTVLTFGWDPTKFFVPVAPDAPLYIAFVNQVAPPVFEKVSGTASGGNVPVPEGISGAAFAVLTTFSGGLNETQLAQFGTLAGPAEVVLS